MLYKANEITPFFVLCSLNNRPIAEPSPRSKAEGTQGNDERGTMRIADFSRFAGSIFDFNRQSAIDNRQLSGRAAEGLHYSFTASQQSGSAVSSFSPREQWKIQGSRLQTHIFLDKNNPQVVENTRKVSGIGQNNPNFGHFCFKRAVRNRVPTY
jgi:hypothetical protein